MPFGIGVTVCVRVMARVRVVVRFRVVVGGRVMVRVRVIVRGRTGTATCSRLAFLKLGWAMRRLMYCLAWALRWRSAASSFSCPARFRFRFRVEFGFGFGLGLGSGRLLFLLREG